MEEERNRLGRLGIQHGHMVSELSHDVRELRTLHLRLTILSLSAGLIFIAAGASGPHPPQHPTSFVSCPLISSPPHPFRCLVSSHLGLDHHPLIIRPTTQSSRPLLHLVWLSVFVLRQTPYMRSCSKDPTDSLYSPPRSPRQLSLGDSCCQIYIYLCTKVGVER